jgi:hypothetical protein
MDRTKYLAHFHAMVLEGITCGLLAPQEWLLSYGRGIGCPLEFFRDIGEFIDEASKELCTHDLCLVEPPTEADLERWFSREYVLEKHYKWRLKSQGVVNDS